MGLITLDLNILNKNQFNQLHFQETLQRYCLTCGDDRFKHPVIGSNKGSLCGCFNNSWLQQYCGDLGLHNLIGMDLPWSCTVCMEARTGLTKHCGITAVGTLETILVWLMELMFDSGSEFTRWDELELCDLGYVFKQLSNPHS